uniref:Uncharacterized protein n=1 Tax=Timema douglasi TaxID=61478 RepID=A0A7R8VRN8_TIMDO|nr:unnamed protein product [Timema douglasi]
MHGMKFPSEKKGQFALGLLQTGEIKREKEQSYWISAVTSTPTSSLAGPSQRTRKRHAVDEKMNERMLKSAYDILRRTLEEPNDHYTSFGNHVANKLRKYDLHTLPYISPPPPPSNLSSPSEGWAATEFAPVENSSAKSISTYNWDEVEGKDEFPELSNRVQGISKSQSGWEDTEWEPLGDANGASNRLEEARKKREEKKLLRQKELEARRATRITGGPMKLGAKKV